LELRLDNVVYRLGLAPTRRAARQMVSHGHVTVDGRKTTIPSRRVHTGDKIGVREGSKTRVPFENLAERLSDRTLSSWLSFDAKSMQGGIENSPTTVTTDTAGDLVSVISFYSR
jgi:small subunit ribosomal protein S4